MVWPEKIDDNLTKGTHKTKVCHVFSITGYKLVMQSVCLFKGWRVLTALGIMNWMGHRKQCLIFLFIITLVSFKLFLWQLWVFFTERNKQICQSVPNLSIRVYYCRLTQIGVVVFSCSCAGSSGRRHWRLAACVLKPPCWMRPQPLLPFLVGCLPRWWRVPATHTDAVHSWQIWPPTASICHTEKFGSPGGEVLQWGN